MNSRLTVSQIRTLQALVKAPRGLTRAQIAQRGKTSVSAQQLGPAYQEDAWDPKYTTKGGPKSLVQLGLVRALQDGSDGLDTIRYTITPAGKTAATSHFVRDHRDKPQVPAKALDQAVVTTRAPRAYGFEEYSHEDLAAVRALLGPRWHDLDLEDLRRQIVNRRKQGAYMPRTSLPEWYEEYRQTEHWQRTRAKALRLLGGCSINQEHQDGLEVWHRAFADRDGTSVLNRESPEDLIVLCQRCYRRDHKSLPKPPEDQPSS